MIVAPESIKENVLKNLSADPAKGLSVTEVVKRREKYGENKLREKKKKTALARFADQFKDVMIIILIIAAIVSFSVVVIEKNWGELFEPLLILLIVILNAVMGVYQEGKAEKALDALKNMSAPHARVIRNGVEEIIEANLLYKVTPDFIIKTGGNHLTDFLIWQSVYSELFFCDVNWNRFRYVDFLRALRDFQSRQRRFGK